jgi:hypothetical protein
MQAGPRVKPHSYITLGPKDIGGYPEYDKTGFRSWRDPGPTGQYLEETVGEGVLPVSGVSWVGDLLHKSLLSDLIL